MKHSFNVAVICFIMSVFFCLIIKDASAKTYARFEDDYKSWNSLHSEIVSVMAENFYKDGLIDSAMTCYNILANRYIDTKTVHEEHILSEVLSNMGYLYAAHYYDFKNAYDCYKRALELSHKNNDLALEMKCRMNLGSLYSMESYILNDTESGNAALDMYVSSYDLSKKEMNEDHHNALIFNIAMTALKLNKIDSVREKLDDFLHTNSQSQLPESKYVYPFIRGLTFYVDGNYMEAENMLRESLSLARECDDSLRTEAIIHYVIAKNHLGGGDLAKALQSCRNALEISKVSGQEDIYVETLKQMSELYALNGNNEISKLYKLKFYETNDSLIDASKIKEVKNLRFLNELKAKNDEVVNLSETMTKQHRVIYWVSIGLLLILIALLFLIKYAKRLRRKNLELYDRIQESIKSPLLLSCVPVCVEVDYSDITDVQAEDKDNVEKVSVPDVSVKYKTSNLTDDVKNEALSKILSYMEQSKDIYDSEFSLDSLSKALNIPRHQLSQVINETGGTNFKTLLNTYRIREACRRLEDFGNFGDQTIESIGQSVGFMSRRNFGVVFKKEIGLSPSAYLKISRQKHTDINKL